jgi:hypothetical protein
MIVDILPSSSPSKCTLTHKHAYTHHVHISTIGKPEEKMAKAKNFYIHFNGRRLLYPEFFDDLP